MGAILWVVKMLTKVLKPFVKIALIESLLEALMGMLGEEGEPTTDDTVTPSEG